jgi:DNA-3-methyladenine glycosylase
VYLVYGMYDCLNIVTEPDGRPAALLVRAVEPLEGIGAMRSGRLASWRRRRKQPPTGEAEAAEAARLDALPANRLASGPGLVASAFGIDRTMTGLDLLDPESPLRLESAPPGEPQPAIELTPRIGIGYAGSPWTDVPWRFVVVGHPSVSGPSSRRTGRAG